MIMTHTCKLWVYFFRFLNNKLTIAMLQPQTTTNNATAPTLQQRQIFRIFNFNIIIGKPRKMLLSKLTLAKADLQQKPKQQQRKKIIKII